MEKERKNIGLFFGSFNPVHIGHLALANWLCEKHLSDEVWFIVSPQNPFKADLRLAPKEKRLEWVRQAIKGYDKFRVSDIEFSMPVPSYTIDTLDLLHSQQPDVTFKVIIGTDNWTRFSQWKQSDRILHEYGLIIYPRRDSDNAAQQFPPEVCFVNAPQIECSSTMIREALTCGEELPFFIPHPIYPDVKLHYTKEKPQTWQK